MEGGLGEGLPTDYGLPEPTGAPTSFELSNAPTQRQHPKLAELEHPLPGTNMIGTRVTAQRYSSLLEPLISVTSLPN